MNLDETTDLFLDNIVSDEQQENELDAQIQNKTKIAEVLIDMNCFSKKFIIKVLSILGFVYFVFGMHVFTFVYMFLSPTFVQKDDPTMSNFFSLF